MWFTFLAVKFDQFKILRLAFDAKRQPNENRISILPGKLQPFWISQKQLSTIWFNLALVLRGPCCARMNKTSPMEFPSLHRDTIMYYVTDAFRIKSCWWNIECRLLWGKNLFTHPAHGQHKMQGQFFSGVSLTAITQERCELYRTSPGGNTPQNSSCMTTYHPSRKLSKLDEPDVRDTAEIGKNS